MSRGSSGVEQWTENRLSDTKLLSNPQKLLSNFISSRRHGTSPETLRFYNVYLNRASAVVGLEATSQDIARFLRSLRCGGGGRHAYFRALRAFYDWLYSSKSGYDLNPHGNPILQVEAPKVERKILPSLNVEEVDHLIRQAECVRDMAIISLFADSGLRLSELASITSNNIDWDRRLIKVTCKGNKEGLAPFGERTESLLKEHLSNNGRSSTLFDLKPRGVSIMLARLSLKTGLPCNAHTFRRTFASVLAKRGIDSLHIMRLGRWESLSMVEHYTRSVKFEDSLRIYRSIVA